MACWNSIAEGVHGDMTYNQLSFQDHDSSRYEKSTIDPGELQSRSRKLRFETG
jgi:hypothetical protein